MAVVGVLRGGAEGAELLAVHVGGAAHELQAGGEVVDKPAADAVLEVEEPVCEAGELAPHVTHTQRRQGAANDLGHVGIDGRDGEAPIGDRLEVHDHAALECGPEGVECAAGHRHSVGDLGDNDRAILDRRSKAGADLDCGGLGCDLRASHRLLGLIEIGGEVGVKRGQEPLVAQWADLFLVFDRGAGEPEDCGGGSCDGERGQGGAACDCAEGAASYAERLAQLFDLIDGQTDQLAEALEALAHVLTGLSGGALSLLGGGDLRLGAVTGRFARCLLGPLEGALKADGHALGLAVGGVGYRLELPL